jgi:hypothetical protein
VNASFLRIHLRGNTARIDFHRWHLQLLWRYLLDGQHFLGFFITMLFAADLQKLDLRGQTLLGKLVVLTQLLQVLVADRCY